MKRLIAALALLVSCHTAARADTIPELFKAAIELGGFTEKCKRLEDACQMPAVMIAPLDIDGALGLFDLRHPVLVRITPEHEGVPGSHMWNATLVHEFVHYLQWTTGVFMVNLSCADKVNKVELPAYEVQKKYLAQRGVEFDYSMQAFFMAMGCSGY